MSHLTGLLLVDARASALNNAGEDRESSTDNAVAVKQIRTTDGRYPYVSAQAVRYWIRTGLASEAGWTPSPVFRESDIAYSDAHPIKYAEDDLFGYMRAPSKSMDEKKVAKRAKIQTSSTPVQGSAVTRISPLRMGTLVAVAPVQVVRDFGTMSRAEGEDANPVIFTHQFYRAQLAAPFGIDLAAAGTFFCSNRAGYRNLDSGRIEDAQAANATEVSVRGFKAWRLPLSIRQERVSKLVSAIGKMEGGAKQSLHYTDTAPSFLLLGILRHGGQPFLRVFDEGDSSRTTFRADVLEEALRVHKDDMLSDLYVGWARGFLDEERKKLEAFIASNTSGVKIHLGHPREVAEQLAAAMKDDAHASWFD